MREWQPLPSPSPVPEICGGCCSVCGQGQGHKNKMENEPNFLHSAQHGAGNLGPLRLSQERKNGPAPPLQASKWRVPCKYLTKKAMNTRSSQWYQESFPVSPAPTMSAAEAAAESHLPRGHAFTLGGLAALAGPVQLPPFSPFPGHSLPLPRTQQSPSRPEALPPGACHSRAVRSLP